MMGAVRVYYLCERHVCGNGRPLFCQQPFLLFREHDVLKLKLQEQEVNIDIQQDIRRPLGGTKVLDDVMANYSVETNHVFLVKVCRILWGVLHGEGVRQFVCQVLLHRLKVI